MRHLALLLILAITGLFATDWTPPSIIPIGPESMVTRTATTIFGNPYERPMTYGIALTQQQIKDAGTTVKAAGQVYTHGVIAYYHGIAVGRIAGNGRYQADRDILMAGLIPQVDALYLADTSYTLSGRGTYWYPDFINCYKARWEAQYVPAVAFGPTMREAIVYRLRIEEFVGIDPRYTTLTPGHLEGSPVPPPPVNN